MDRGARPTRLGTHKKRTIAVTAALAVIAFSIAACGSSASSGGSSGGNSSKSGSYNIGFTSDLSGQYGDIGQGLKSGVAAYFSAANKAGGINGHQVNVSYLDDANLPASGVANFTKFVTQDNDSAVIGFQYSAVAAAVAPLAAQYKVPLLASTVSVSQVEPAEPYFYATTVQTAEYAGAQMALAKQLMTKSPPAGGTVRIASITSGSSTALQQWSNSIKSIAQGLGWDVVDQEITPQDGIDMSASLSRVIASKPDILIMAIGSDPWIIAGMKQMAGTTFPIVSYDSPAWSTVQSLASNRFYYVSAMAYATSTATPQYVKDATAAGLSPNGLYIIKGYEEGIVIGNALKTCGYPCSGQQLEAALNKTDVSTGGIIQGNVQYSPTDHEGVREMNAYLWSPGAKAPQVVATDLVPGTTLGS